ncbi:hypothetical protein [uncultured Planococcus sp.]|uniref:hypothetical protein n=1 Tax=uncultured Planococcus sp. TaxID=337815 RepID=UPI00262D2A5E|nr:hypothetical protein [uncultured Planococcus sp.]
MTRKKSLEFEDIIYTGEVIDGTNQTKNYEVQGQDNEHTIALRKMDAVSEVLQIGQKILDIVEIRANSETKINEIDAQIRVLEAMTEREVQARQQATVQLQEKGKVIRDILRELTPVLISSNLKTEERTAAMQLYNDVINQVLKNNE